MDYVRLKQSIVRILNEFNSSLSNNEAKASAIVKEVLKQQIIDIRNNNIIPVSNIVSHH